MNVLVDGTTWKSPRPGRVHDLTGRVLAVTLPEMVDPVVKQSDRWINRTESRAC